MTDFRLEQFWNVCSCIDSTVDGIRTEEREEQPLNAYIPMDSVKGMETEEREEQPRKAPNPIDVTKGMETEERAIQLRNA